MWLVSFWPCLNSNNRSSVLFLRNFFWYPNSCLLPWFLFLSPCCQKSVKNYDLLKSDLPSKIQTIALESQPNSRGPVSLSDILNSSVPRPPGSPSTYVFPSRANSLAQELVVVCKCTETVLLFSKSCQLY